MPHARVTLVAGTFEITASPVRAHVQDALPPSRADLATLVCAEPGCAPQFGLGRPVQGRILAALRAELPAIWRVARAAVVIPGGYACLAGVCQHTSAATIAWGLRCAGRRLAFIAAYRCAAPLKKNKAVRTWLAAVYAVVIGALRGATALFVADDAAIVHRNPRFPVGCTVSGLKYPEARCSDIADAPGPSTLTQAEKRSVTLHAGSVDTLSSCPTTSGHEQGQKCYQKHS